VVEVNIFITMKNCGRSQHFHHLQLHHLLRWRGCTGKRLLQCFSWLAIGKFIPLTFLLSF